MPPKDTHMSPIPWDPTLETGDALVDAQHKDIFALINEVDSMEGDDRAALLGVVDRLMEHVEVHFTTEELLMLRVGYPAEARESHRDEHRALQEDARATALGFRGSWDLTKAPFADFLAKLLEHILTQDRALVDYVQAQGMVAQLP